MIRRCLTVFCCCLCLAWRAGAQTPLPVQAMDYLEQLAEEGEDEAVEELMELYDTYSATPLNLNDTTHVLEGVPFVNDLQRESLRAYIVLFGQLLSIDELYNVHGFDSLTVELLRPITTASPITDSPPFTFKRMLQQGRHNLVTGISGTIEQARGYRDSIYEGNNLRLMWRYQFNYKDLVRLQLSGDKDPGEAFFAGSQRQGFNFYGYSLVVNDLWKPTHSDSRKVWVRRIVAGQYNAQFGQGLTLWSCYGSRQPFGTRIHRTASGLRPGSAFVEYGYLRGAGTTVALGEHLDVTVCYSWADRAATLLKKSLRDSLTHHVQSLYNSGYFRTATEVEKQHQLDEQLLGGHLEFHTRQLRIGLTAAAMQLSKEILPATYVYNDNAFRGNKNLNAGIDFSYRYRRLLIFGEAALCANHLNDTLPRNISPAAIAGAEFLLNNEHSFSGQFRYYGANYQNLHASALGHGSTPQNEWGGGLNYQGLLPWDIQTTLSADWFVFPHMKYLVYAPSHGCDYRVLLERASSLLQGVTYRMRYRYKERGRNVTPTHMVDGQYQLEQTYSHQWQADLLYHHRSLQLTTRFAYNRYHGEVTETKQGFLLYQDVQYRPERMPLNVAARVAWFSVEDYEARIYTVESDFIYNYNSSVYQNKGFRLYLLLQYNINPNWNIGLKYACTAYTDRDTFGSSYEQIDANHRQQWRIQMRLKW